MTNLLLDFPWQLESVLLPYSEACAALHDFDRLCQEERLQRAGFISQEEYSHLLQIPRRPAGLNTLRAVLQVLPHYRRAEFGEIRAMPSAGPDNLSDNWKLSLRQEMVELDDWRTPQIIACENRRADWRPSTTGATDRSEVRIACEDQSGYYSRVIAFLGSYSAHHYARSDRDPWDLRRTKTHDEERPCCLPKPPRLRQVPFEDLRPELENARDDGWHLREHYCFVPPEDWSPEDWATQETKRTWRDNGSFRHSIAPDAVHRGPVDFQGRVWSWDIQERHWDVQLVIGGYWSISHTGRLLRKSG